jgi:hypothetical protein
MGVSEWGPVSPMGGPLIVVPQLVSMKLVPLWGLAGEVRHALFHFSVPQKSPPVGPVWFHGGGPRGVPQGVPQKGFEFSPRSASTTGFPQVGPEGLQYGFPHWVPQWVPQWCPQWVYSYWCLQGVSTNGCLPWRVRTGVPFKRCSLRVVPRCVA